MDFQDLYRISAAASDVGFHDWVRRFVFSGALAAFVLVLSRTVVRLSRRWPRLGRHWPRWAFALAAVLAVSGVAHAEEDRTDDEVEARLHFIQTRLKAESVQAHAWEYGWGVVDIAGAGFGAYQIAQSHSTAETADGIVGVVKSVGGVAGLALAPLKTARGAHELDDLSDATPEDRAKRLQLAESLLRRNAEESDVRYSWKPHVINAAINLLGGVVTGLCGDWARGAQSAGIGLAVGELQIWTRPWNAKRDLRQYRREFGGLAFQSIPQPSALAVRSPVSVTFAF
jgi:hypothetical protein